MVKILLILGFAAAVLFAGYLGLAFILQKVDKAPATRSNGTEMMEATTSGDTKTAKTAKGSDSSDQQLIDNWDTGCLVPDPNSPWAERHTFVMSSNGTGNHKRYSGDSCAALGMDHDDNFTFVIPSQGKINLSYTSGIGAGMTIHDIYQVSRNTLRFGHAFCNCTSSDGNFGTSEGGRFTRLNDFLVYKKQ